MSKRIVLLQALASTPKEIDLRLKSVADTAICQRPEADQWSLADVVNHLIYVESHYLERLQQVIKLECPSLPAILPDEAKHDVQAIPIELITRFEEAREETLSFLKDIPPEEWGRTAVHETRGDVNFHFLVQFLVEHDAVHLNQMAEVGQQLQTLFKGEAHPAIHRSA